MRSRPAGLWDHGVMISPAAYREGVRHLCLSIHRLEESQVAGDPPRGQAEDGAIVIEGDLQQRVFRLSTEWFRREREREKTPPLPWQQKRFISFSFPSCSFKTTAEKTYQTGHFQVLKSWSSNWTAGLWSLFGVVGVGGERAMVAKMAN